MGKPPAGWEEHKDATGNVYYYNPATGISQYERPVEEKKEPPKPPPNPPLPQFISLIINIKMLKVIESELLRNYFMVHRLSLWFTRTKGIPKTEASHPTVGGRHD